MAFRGSWPIIGQLALCLACHQLILSVASLQTTLNNDKQTSGNNQKVGQRNQSNEQAAATLDEILRDTHQLLDSLDRKLNAVDEANNKTRQFKHHEAEMRMMREFAGQNQPTSNVSRSLDEEHRLTSLAEGFSSERRLATAETADSLLAASSEFEQQQQQQNSAKRTRQLFDDTPPLGQSSQAGSARLSDNQFTEKHIHFSLNLMRAVFSSHSSELNSIDSFLISPVSIQMVLMMMHLGARGQTRRELANCLHLTPASATTSTSSSSVARDGASQSGSNSTNLNKDPKLFRRHQQQPLSAAANPKQVATVALLNQHQQQLASGGSQRVHQQVAHLNKQMLQEFQQNQGNTFHEQFGSAMRQLLKDPSVMKALSSTNQIFLQRDLPLSAQFEWAVKNYYGTDLKQVDFRNQDDHEQQPHNKSSSASSNSTSSKANSNNVRLMINEWVERQTKGKISNFLMSPVPSSTLLMALNLIFFKGDWQYKFDPADTQPDGLFSLANGRTVKVPMMVNKLPLAHAHDPQMKASLIELPYKAQRLSLFIVLPDETNGIFDLMRQLTSSSFASLISKMRKPSGSPTAASGPASANANSLAADLSGGGINVRIPKFTIESSPRMSQLLSQQLGLKTLFAADLADLSGMFQQKRPKPANASADSLGGSANSQPAVIQVGLDELLHKAVLEVHEQGSVAAAASAVIVERVGVFNGQYFEADHPFLFFLMDKQSGLVLFSGVFAGPQQQDGGQEQQATRKPAQQSAQTNSTATIANEHQHSNLAAGRSLGQTNSIN